MRIALPAALLLAGNALFAQHSVDDIYCHSNGYFVGSGQNWYEYISGVDGIHASYVYKDMDDNFIYIHSDNVEVAIPRQVGWHFYWKYKGEKDWKQVYSARIKNTQNIQPDKPKPTSAKQIYKAQKFKNEDWNSWQSTYCYQRMKQSDNFVVMWHKEFGNDLSMAPACNGKDMTSDIDGVLKALESYFSYYQNILGFGVGSQNLSTHKINVYMDYTTRDEYYGGSDDKFIGAMFLHPIKPRNGKYNMLAHELAHSLQHQALYCDKPQKFGWYDYKNYNIMLETSAQWMLWQVNKHWVEDEEYHWKDYSKQFYMPFLCDANKYHAPYVLEYWTQKRGEKLIASLFRDARRNEWVIETYLRQTQMTYLDFCREMFEANSYIIGMSYPRVWRETRKYAHQLSTPTTNSNGWLSPQQGYEPQDFGFNVIPIPYDGKVTVSFSNLSNYTLYYGIVKVPTGTSAYEAPQITVYNDRDKIWHADVTSVNGRYKSYLVVMGVPQYYTKDYYPSSNKGYYKVKFGQ